MYQFVFKVPSSTKSYPRRFFVQLAKLWVTGKNMPISFDFFICCALFEYPRTRTVEDLEETFFTLESPDTLFKAVFSCSSTYPLSLNLTFIISTCCSKDSGVVQMLCSL